MAKGKKTGSQKTSVLTGQKPKKSSRKKPRNYRAMIRLAGITLAGVATIYGSYFLYQQYERMSFFDDDQAPRNWSVSFSARTDAKIAPQERASIARYITEKVHTGSHAELSTLVAKLQAKYAAERVNVIRTTDTDLLVTVTMRRPVMRIRADKERLVTGEGIVYGVAEEEHQALPLVTGVLPDESHALTWQDDASIAIDDEQRALLGEAMALIESGKAKNIEFDEINYVKFRGFLPLIKDSHIEVALGRAPFGERIGKLDQILLKLKKQGTSATRIELDYSGKAFIKEKTL